MNSLGSSTFRSAMIVLTVAMCGCSVSDENRCDPGQEYVEVGQQMVCRNIADAAADTQAETSHGQDATTDAGSGGGGSSGADSGLGGGDSSGDPAGDGGDLLDSPADNTTSPSGLDQTCKTTPDCDSFEANYCLVNPQTGSGYCTVKDCSPASDACPQGHKCCDMPFGDAPNFCATQSDYDTLGGMGMCAK